jgi:hypothetical protein
MAAADTSPGMTPSDPYTEQHAAEEMKKWVVNELNADVETKLKITRVIAQRSR